MNHEVTFVEIKENVFASPGEGSNSLII